MIIEHFSVGPLGCNCTIVGDEDKKEALVIDPGGDDQRIVARLAELGLRCVGILHTHTHFDHVGATREVQQATDAPAMLHESDHDLYRAVQMQLDAFGVPLRAPVPVDIDRYLNDGHSVSAGDVELGVLHTPGHTPGSLCFSMEAGVTGVNRPVVVAGDTLFREGIGRTDLWGGDAGQIDASIRQKLLCMPDETLVITGHGPVTTIGHERQHNPFLRAS